MKVFNVQGYNQNSNSHVDFGAQAQALRMGRGLYTREINRRQQGAVVKLLKTTPIDSLPEKLLRALGIKKNP